ncbi:hypothetical protein B0F89_1534 [Malaciobacter marinus]|jgi:hypothetical protein|uniref:HEPN domain-containing protein n=1 Tax=Malaciobacter marinus TaxID=505249 RepID=A0AB36ZSK2_9BACT|nr:hypothetical protein [Malaciobacter marinus]PPK57185.1 hypothetical protein B0F89_1534 [Malaciobacter marinus]
MINKDTYFDEPDFKSHMYFLIEEASLIVEKDPFEALKMFNDANKLYDEVGCFALGTLDLAVSIVVNIAKQDVEKSLNYLNIIEVDYYRLEALEKIRQYPQSKEIVDLIDKMINELKNIIDSYEKV